MTIENTLTRIADALERIADLQAGRNLILEAGSAAAEVAGAAVEKAATRGRKKKEETASDTASAQAPAPAADATSAPVTENTNTNTTAASEPETKATSTAPTVEQLQLRGPDLIKKFGKDNVTGLIKKINPAQGNISSMTDEQRTELWAAWDALEVGATTDAEFS